jgi:multicomponent Na+:H+ antiporter subunit D
VFVISSMFTGGAVLRVTGCVFLGWGRSQSGSGSEPQARQAREEGDEQSGARGRTPPLMVLVPAMLLVSAIAIGLIPGVVPGIETAAYHFTDHLAYSSWVLRGELVHFPKLPTTHVETYDYLYAVAAVVGALAMAVGDYITWWTVGAAVLGAASLLPLT